MLFLNGELTPTLDAPPARNRPGVPGASVCEDEDACAESVPVADVDALDEDSVDDCESWESGWPEGRTTTAGLGETLM